MPMHWCWDFSCCQHHYQHFPLGFCCGVE
ncbi:hypothetical protein NC653_001109 [Populus alba x Populus x berolinensis]|uniref:Uncharacterized protein n=1 Tax=Populus alba x Populus x berolinensis TaxID=444605 RepID=A0AAD6RLC0_9ROSI|nr:hypothetical protein NC653_001109 [Populus alba x Populus x berolinensis]